MIDAAKRYIRRKCGKHSRDHSSTLPKQILEESLWKGISQGDVVVWNTEVNELLKHIQLCHQGFECGIQVGAKMSVDVFCGVKTGVQGRLPRPTLWQTPHSKPCVESQA